MPASKDRGRRHQAVPDGGATPDEETNPTEGAADQRERTDTTSGYSAGERGSITEGESGRLFSLAVALFAVTGGGYGITVLAVSALGPSGTFALSGGSGAGVAAARTVSLVFSVGPLVSLGSGAWIGHSLDEGVTGTALVATAAGALVMIAVVFLFAMVGATVLSSGSGGGVGFSSPGVGDQVGPLVGLVVGTALTGALAAEVVHDL